MKVFVTGGAGYIGRALVPMLVEKGFDVTVIDRKFLNYDDVESEYRNMGCNFITGDIRYFDPNLLRGHDAVIDLAALSNDPSGDLDPMKTWDINYLGRVRVARLAKKLGISKYFSLCSPITSLSNPFQAQRCIHQQQNCHAQSRHLARLGC